MKDNKNSTNELGITEKQLKQMSARIKERREELELSQAALAKLCGLANQSTIGHYEIATRAPTLAIVQSLAKALKTTVPYILHGIAPLYNFKPAAKIGGVRYVPIVSLNDIKNWEINMTNFIGNADHPHIAVPSNVSDKAFCVEMIDDSMSATQIINNITFLEGDKLIFDPEREAKIGNYILVEIPGVNTPVFRHFIESAGSVYLKPLNPAYKMLDFKDNFKVLGVLSAKIQTFE